MYGGIFPDMFGDSAVASTVLYGHTRKTDMNFKFSIYLITKFNVKLSGVVGGWESAAARVGAFVPGPGPEQT